MRVRANCCGACLSPLPPLASRRWFRTFVAGKPTFVAGCDVCGADVGTRENPIVLWMENETREQFESKVRGRQ